MQIYLIAEFDEDNDLTIRAFCKASIAKAIVKHQGFGRVVTAIIDAIPDHIKEEDLIQSAEEDVAVAQTALAEAAEKLTDLQSLLRKNC